jgi:alpha,alpha-trehalase
VTTFVPRPAHEFTSTDPLPLDLSPIEREALISLRRLSSFRDGKLLADSVVVSVGADHTPNNWQHVLDLYTAQSERPGFDGNAFCREHFILPQGSIPLDDTGTSQNRPPIEDHIDSMWSKLRQESPADTASGLLALPHPYYAPGERFNESYGWDTYFTALGLAAQDKWDEVYDAVDNHAYMINRFGHVPNGNRKYFLSRSHPPVFSHMVELLASHHGPEVIAHYVPTMQREYAFWMDGASDLPTGAQSHAHRRVVGRPNFSLVNS